MRLLSKNVVGMAMAFAITALCGLQAHASVYYKMKIQFSGYNKTETLTNFPVLVAFSNNINNSGFSYAQFISAGGWDLRFTDYAETTNLNYEIERWNTGGVSYVWAQIPALTNNCSIWAKWANPTYVDQMNYTTNGAVWTNGFVCVWHMKETSGSHYDSTSNRFASTFPGSPLSLQGSATGAVDGADFFNGANQRVDIPALNLNSNSVTISAWVQGHQNADYAGMVFWRNGANTASGIFSYSNTLRYSWLDDNTTYGWNSGLSIPVDQMAFVAFAKEPSRSRLYVNGAEAIHNYGNGNSASFNSSTDIGLDSTDTSNRRWVGMMDEVRIENAARSANWIWACFMTVGSNTNFCVCGAVVGVTNPLAINNDGGASGVGVSAATLNGNLTSTGTAPASVYAFWGKSDGGAAWGGWGNTNSMGTSPTGMITSYVTGLSSGTVYYYRFYATNVGGSCWAPNTTNFTTLLSVAPPAINNDGGASGIAATSALLNGNLTSTGNAPTCVYVLWGTSDGGTALGGWGNAANLGTNGTGVITSGATSLAPGTLYYYRFYATNVAGFCWAPSTTNFTTLSSTNTSFTQWQRRMKITFSGYNKPETLTNFPALVVLGQSISGFLYSQFASLSGGDLRFSAADGSTELNYEVEQWNTGGNSFVWVQVPAISSSSDYIWAYWGNLGATTPPAYTTNGATWDASFKGVWHLCTNNVAGNLPDSTTNGFTGTNSGSTSVPGLIANGSGFNGSSEISMGYIIPPLALADNFSWEFWAYQIGSGDLVGNRNNGSSGWIKFMSSMWEYKVGGGDGSISYTAIPNGSWIHHAGTKAGTSLKYYRNGVYQGGNTLSTTNGVLPFYLGSGGEIEYWNGWLDEVRLSTAARSSNWVWACWANQTSGSVFCAYGSPSDPRAPGISDSAGATSVGGSSAVLNGNLTTTGAASTYVWAYWGVNDAGTNKAGWTASVGLGQCGPGPISLPVLGLRGETAYYYRFYASNAFASAWADSSSAFTTTVNPVNYGWKMKITFSGYTGTERLTNFPALVVFRTSLSGFAYSELLSPKGYDLRFLSSNETTVLNYETEQWSTGSDSYVWVQVPILSSSNDYIWAYFGYSGATSAPAMYCTNGATWNANFCGVWHLCASNAAGNLPDSTASGFTGTNHASTSAAGMIASGRSFNGSNTCVEMGNIIPSLATNDTFSWEFWAFQIADVNDTGVIVGNRDGANGNSTWIKFMPSGFAYPNSAGYVYAAIPTGSWAHHAMVKSGTNLVYYRNGIYQGQSTANQATGYVLPFFLGGDPVAGEWWNGVLDEVRLSTVARSPGWLSACYVNQQNGSAFTSCSKVKKVSNGMVLTIR